MSETPCTVATAPARVLLDVSPFIVASAPAPTPRNGRIHYDETREITTPTPTPWGEGPYRGGAAVFLRRLDGSGGEPEFVNSHDLKVE